MNYLSRIAARDGSDISPITPAISFAPPVIGDPFMGHNIEPMLNDAVSPDSFPGHQIANPGKSIAPKADEEIKPGALKSATPEPGINYIAKYIERATVKEDDSRQFSLHAKAGAVNHIAAETNTNQQHQHFDREERPVFQKTEQRNMEIKPVKEMRSERSEALPNTPLSLNAIKEPAALESDGANSKKAVEPQSGLEPSPPNKKQRESSDAMVYPKVAKLMPAQPNPTIIPPKAIKSEPKLVIGKITVEVLPPVNPKPAKIISRVVQTSSANTSTSNKLSFGLGQL